MFKRPGPPASALRVGENPSYIDVSVRAGICRDLRETLGGGLRRNRQAHCCQCNRARREVKVHLRRVVSIRRVEIQPRPIAPQTPLPVREHGP